MKATFKLDEPHLYNPPLNNFSRECNGELVKNCVN